MRVTTMLRQADPLPSTESGLSVRARAELRTLVGADPTPDTAIIHRSSGRRRIGRVLVLAATALAVVAVFAVPLLQGRSSAIPAIPAGTPTPAATSAAAGQWVEVAPVPLAGRRDAVTAWVADSFLVLGGDATPPCTKQAGCEQEATLLADGARYTPATNTWTRIANAPTPLVHGPGAANPYPTALTIDDTVYVLQGGDFVAYDAGTDTWATLPAPPDTAYLAGVTSDVIVAYPASPCGDAATVCNGTDGTPYFTYDPETRAWASHTAKLALPGNVYGATVAGGYLVVSWLDGNTLGVASIDLATGKVTTHPNLGSSQRPVPVTVGDWAVWPRDDHSAWLLNPATQEMTMAEMPAKPGSFYVNASGWSRNLPITTDSMIALAGHLYDPTTRLWSTTPALPVPTQDPVIATGPNAILACNGWDAPAYATTCYALQPSPATQPTP